MTDLKAHDALTLAKLKDATFAVDSGIGKVSLAHLHGWYGNDGYIVRAHITDVWSREWAASDFASERAGEAYAIGALKRELRTWANHTIEGIERRLAE